MFEFSYDMAKSYLPYGKYEIMDEKLILETEDAILKYIFKIDGNNLIFQEDGSSSTDTNIGEKVVDGSVFYLESNLIGDTTSVEAMKTNSEAENISFDEAVILALKTQGNYYFYPEECFAEGHIILGYDDSSIDSTKIYALTTIGNYGFVNGNFEKVSGTGTIPAVVTLEKDNNVLIEFPLDGEGNNESIEEMFPKEYHERIYGYYENDINNLKQQEHVYAQKYLNEIGREAKIDDHFERILLTSLGVSVEVSNKVADYVRKLNYKYPYFIGTVEYLEGDSRVVYEMSYDKNSDEIKLKNYVYDTNEFIEESVIDAKTGELISFKMQ